MPSTDGATPPPDEATRYPTRCVGQLFACCLLAARLLVYLHRGDGTTCAWIGFGSGSGSGSGVGGTWPKAIKFRTLKVAKSQVFDEKQFKGLRPYAADPRPRPQTLTQTHTQSRLMWFHHLCGDGQASEQQASSKQTTDQHTEWGIAWLHRAMA